MKFSTLKFIFLIAVCFFSTFEIRAQLCGRYTTTLQIKTAEDTPIENSVIQLLPVEKDETKGKIFVRDEKDFSKFSITFSEGHQLAENYKLIISADGFETLDREINFPHCKKQTFDIRLNAKPQKSAAVLSGKIYNPDNKELPMSAVTVTGSNKLIFKTISDENGFYRLRLPKGIYEIEFHKYGFKRTIVHNFDGSAGNKTIDVKMEIGHCNDCSGNPYSDEPENIRKPFEVDFSKPREKTGIMSGSSVDERGAILPNLTISFINGKGEEFQARTNMDGKFSIKLPYGTYKISAEFNGLLKNKERKIKVNKLEYETERIVLFCRYKDRKQCFVI